MLEETEMKSEAEIYLNLLAWVDFYPEVESEEVDVLKKIADKYEASKGLFSPCTRTFLKFFFEYVVDNKQPRVKQGPKLSKETNRS